MFSNLKSGNPQQPGILVTGPCSAESAEQVLDTARSIAEFFPAAVFRAGSWKPRTRPNLFEGHGADALRWLNIVKAETGLKTATEVALPSHVELALKHEIDVLWIGARTTGNPFMVQELATSLKGVDVPVMIKNPLHPDLHLWIGGIERIQNAGIKNIAAVHRGFYTYEQSEYRNMPRWELVAQLRKLFPAMPLICDISHIAGSRSLLKMVAQQSVDIDFNGMMVETHNDPVHALSDAGQQITPYELKELLQTLSKRKPYFNEEVTREKLEKIRSRIDEIDRRLLATLKERMDCAEEIGELKKEFHVSILQLERWKEVIDLCMQKADENGLYKEFIRNIFIQIHDEAIRLQSAILAGEEKINAR